MARFPPEDMVTTSVTFNRCLYAQLKQQDFQVCWLPKPCILRVSLCVMNVINADEARWIKSSSTGFCRFQLWSCVRCVGVHLGVLRSTLLDSGTEICCS